MIVAARRGDERETRRRLAAVLDEPGRARLLFDRGLARTYGHDQFRVDRWAGQKPLRPIKV